MGNKEKDEEVLELLRRYGNNKTRVAAELGINRSNLYKILKRLLKDGKVNGDYEVEADGNTMTESDFKNQCLTYAINHFGEEHAMIYGNLLVVIKDAPDDVGLTRDEIRIKHGFNRVYEPLLAPYKLNKAPLKEILELAKYLETTAPEPYPTNVINDYEDFQYDFWFSSNDYSRKGLQAIKDRLDRYIKIYNKFDDDKLPMVAFADGVI
jgi:hypothetical protein